MLNMYLTQLRDIFLQAGADLLPLPDQVLIAELRPLDFDANGSPIIFRDRLRTPAEYETRFAELVGSGVAWVNLSYYGVMDGSGLVLVEVANVVSTTKSAAVNLSGPPAAVLAARGDVTNYIVIGR
jgi:hypothetical protein